MTYNIFMSDNWDREDKDFRFQMGYGFESVAEAEAWIAEDRRANARHGEEHRWTYYIVPDGLGE